MDLYGSRLLAVEPYGFGVSMSNRKETIREDLVLDDSIPYRWPNA